MRKGCVGCLCSDQIYDRCISQIPKDVTRTARGRMKSIDPGLTTKGEGKLQISFQLIKSNFQEKE